MTLILQSPAFTNGRTMPDQYTCDGQNISPPLEWQGEPSDTKTFALVMDDPDAPGGIWDHWLIFNLPGSLHQLPENLKALPEGAHFGKNSWGSSNYGGPCPPKGEHRYVFKLYALDTLLKLGANINKSGLEAAIRGHILDSASLMAIYRRKP